MSWTNTIYGYVQCKNQICIEFSADQLTDYISDESFIMREQSMQLGLHELARERNVWPHSGEVKLRITDAEVLKDSVIAHIVLTQSLLHDSPRGQYMEERMTHERVTLHYFQNKWWITRIEHPESEIFSLRGDLEDDNLAAPSLPFYNYSILKRGFDVYPSRVTYNRARVAEYAEQWWDSYNPSYMKFDVDCTNYVSQCIFAGGAPMNYTGKRDIGWWYVGKNYNQELWSYSWAVANALGHHVPNSKKGLRGRIVSSPKELDIGDMISYDWEGDGRYTHSTIVVAKDSYGMPLVNAHTTNSKHRFWAYRDSYAWTANTRYSLIHIDDMMET
ncbi:amidase domain-containing protein [Paenibacillus sp. N1-5-1-14]|uniref:amidase domain-containing protein n=1 Tax=Paenibacillus radicibacter TaxID=2972488 RepID=UPI00215947F9|nr:amidase domain-containing protein [Paenibacillus radicibacter]MCR8643052.1 amidase domain-containing protein [Paenibacillus radicibacter]